jgi:hypothetical protein
MEPMEKPEQLFPYPTDPLTRIGFVVGDLVNLGIILLIFVPIIMSFRG